MCRGSEDKAAGIYGIDIADSTKQIGGISVPMYTNWRKKLKTLISGTWPHLVIPTTLRGTQGNLGNSW